MVLLRDLQHFHVTRYMDSPLESDESAAALYGHLQITSMEALGNHGCRDVMVTTRQTIKPCPTQRP